MSVLFADLQRYTYVTYVIISEYSLSLSEIWLRWEYFHWS